MAFVPQQLPEDEKNQFGRTGQTTPQPVPPQGGGSAGTGTNAAPGQATSTQFGSNAAKLSDYLSANKDQVQQFGQQVAGNLNKDYTSAQNAVDQGFGNFNQQVNQGYTQNNPDLVNQAASDPSGFAKNPDNVSGFKALYNDQYTGPANFESTPIYSNVNDQVNKAVSNANLVGSNSGLQSYLSNNLGTANNMPGTQILDTALLQRSPEARTAIQQAAAPSLGLTNYLSGQTQTADANAANAQKTATGISQGLQNQFAGTSGYLPTLQNDLSARQAQTISSQGTAANQAIQDYQQGKATPDELKLLGFNTSDLSDQALTKEWQNAQALSNDYKVPTNWAGLFTAQSPDVVYNSPGTVATPEETARVQALGQLTGNNTDWLGSASPNGSLVDINRQGLSDLGPALNLQDQQNVLKNAQQLLGTTDSVGTLEQFNNAMKGVSGGNQVSPQMLLQRAQETKDQSLIDAIQRMYNTSTPTSGGGGVIRAS